MAFDIQEFKKRTESEDINPIDKFLIKMIGQEISAWERAQVFVTPKVSYNMRTVIERNRKNYYGVFDFPFDEATGREKFWVPLTESTVENIVKNIDIDTKDINLRSKTQFTSTMATIDKEILRDKLRRMGFGEKLDQIERNLAIDGTVVVKSYKGVDQSTGKETLKFDIVDLLNCYCDPQAKSIQSMSRFTERIIMPIDTFKNQKGWKDLDDVDGSLGIPLTKDTARSLNTQKEVEVFCTEGMFPRYVLTGKEEDKKTWFFGRVFASGVTRASGGYIHKIVNLELDPLHKNRRKSYEEAWFTRVPGRWHGRGIPEKLFSMQTYINEVVNLRVNNSRVFQTGLFKAKKGRGVSNRSLQNLVAGGVLLLDDLADVEQFQMNNPSLNDSIADESNMVNWAQKVTNNQDIGGDQLPASTPATTVAIANQNVKSAFALIQEGLGMFLQRVIQNHFLPILKVTTEPMDILRVTGDPATIAKIDQTIVENLANKKILEYIMENGEMPDKQSIEMAMASALQDMRKMGKDRFVTSDVFLSSDYDVEVYVTNEDFDKNTLVTNILQSITQLAPLTQNLDVDALTVELYDLLGLSGERFIKKPDQTQMLQQQAMQQMQPNNAAPGVMGNAQAGEAMAPGNNMQGNQSQPTPGQLIGKTTQMAMAANQGA